MLFLYHLETPGHSEVWVKLEMYDPASNSDSNGFGAIACAEFFHDVLDMSLHRFFRDEKERCDVAVGRRRGGSLRLDSMGAVCSQQLNGKVNCPESGASSTGRCNTI